MLFSINTYTRSRSLLSQYLILRLSMYTLYDTYFFLDNLNSICYSTQYSLGGILYIRFWIFYFWRAICMVWVRSEYFPWEAVCLNSYFALIISNGSRKTINLYCFRFCRLGLPIFGLQIFHYFSISTKFMCLSFHLILGLGYGIIYVL